MTDRTKNSVSAGLAAGAIPPAWYVVDPEHTRVLFSVSHFGFSTYFGEFVRPSGALYFDPARLDETRLEVTVPVANVSTSNRVLDDELRSSDWLDSSAFPLLEFHAETALAQGADAWTVAGELSLHGVTRPVVFEARFVGAGINPKKDVYTIGFDIRGRIRRSEFGVHTALPWIGDALEIIISAAFELAPPIPGRSIDAGRTAA